MELSETLEKVRDGFLDKAAELELLQKKAADQVRRAPRCRRRLGNAHEPVFLFTDAGKIPGGRPAAEHREGWRDRLAQGRTGQRVPEILGVQTQARPSGQHQRGGDFSTEGRDWTDPQENSKDSASLTPGRNRFRAAEDKGRRSLLTVLLVFLFFKNNF